MISVTGARWISLGLAGLLALQIAGSADAIERVPRPSVSGFAEVDGISLFYQVYGSGDPILLIHGGLSDSDVWRRQLGILSRKHRVIVADSRGQGRSTRDETPITYALMADDYLALLDQLGERAVALVGWSDGGIIGLDIAIRHPERLTRMFIQAANATPDGALAYDPTKDVPELKHYADVGKEIHALWANEPNFTPDQLSSISVPTEIVIGEHDEAISREHTIFIANTIPGARFVILPDVGHSAPVEDPKGYAEAVLNFIDGTS
ncbi:esterase [Aureimonas sp. Leaf454]|uniref:alpha/beta fold hydrolase n=1 Tax=Aureimonas sp. Leaf454 TaxID=1736381 RepID=UPI0006FEA04C|nr:alpha/beta fold hydrolase [Aureimonas sp. Leaf454]KQT50789.1 esterase [Aureimonas sp. Leaf454]